jgi:hypothetical protein
MKREIVFASLMAEYAFHNGFSLNELQEYFKERVYCLNVDWDDSFNEGLDMIDALYSHLSNHGHFDYSKYPFA